MVDRELLEKEAVDEVCACRYYDLQDTLGECSDAELLAIIGHTHRCEICGQ